MSLLPEKYQWPLSPYNYPKLKCIEPVKRKHGTTEPEWQCHRFPIKGGIFWGDAMIQDMLRPNPWLKTPKREWFVFKGPIK